MIVQNCFHDNPKLHNYVTELRKKVEYLEASVHKGGYRHHGCSKTIEYKYDYHFKTRYLNVEDCIRILVEHCIVTYALDHPEEQTFNTKACKWERDDLRKMILFHDIRTEYEIRGLKFVDDMIDLVNTILTIM